jgi:DNA polymerase I-like protein with 3'-5' exonuclease and polymerase domains
MHEALHKMPFVGASGRMLRGLLEQIGYHPQQDVFYTNAALCHPTVGGEAKKKQLSQAVPACRERLRFALSQFGTEVPVLALGNPAMHILGIQPDMWTTERLSGKPAIGTIHPAAVLHGDGGAMTFIVKVLEKLEQGNRAVVPKPPEPFIIDRVSLLPSLTLGPIEQGPITIDIETSTFEWHDPQGHIELIGIGMPVLASDPTLTHGTTSYIFTRDVIYSEEGKAYLRQFIQENHPFIGGHNFKFDILFLDRLLDCGLDFGWDTAVMGFGLYPLWYKGLKEQARFYFDVEDWSLLLRAWLQGHIKDASQRTYDKAPYEILIPYLNKDLHYNSLLAVEVERRMHEAGKWEAPYLLHDLPVARLLAQLEKTGVPINPEQMKVEEEAFEHDRLAAAEEAAQITGGEITNPNSTKQCAAFLYDKLGLRHTAKGLKPRSTAAGALGTLDPEAHPVLAVIQRYRRILKLKSSYISNMWDKLRPHSLFGTAAHPTFNQIKVVTSRLSAQSPPIQTIPKKNARLDGNADYGRRIKSMFVAPPGYKIVAADGEGFELRVAAALSNDLWLLAAFNAGQDVHGAACDMMYGAGQWDDAMRTKEKNVMFGLLYGGTLEGIVSSAAIPAGVANKVYYFFKDTLSVLMEWREEVFQQAKKDVIISPYFNRRFEFPLVHKGNEYDIRKYAVNYLVQGTASNILMEAGIRAQPQLEELGGHIIIPLHDELIAIAPDAVVLEVAGILVQEIEAAGARAFPKLRWKASAEIGPNWGALKEIGELNK